MLQQEELKWLKEKIGQQVNLIVHREVRDEEWGNMNSITSPRVADEEISFVFLGIFGIGGKPLYIHGKDPTDSKDKLFRNNLNMWANEDTGNPTHEDTTTLLKLDAIDIERWFSNSFIFEGDSLELKKRIKAQEPDEKYLTEEILKGTLHYLPGVLNIYYSIFDEPKFINKVLTYLERIV